MIALNTTTRDKTRARRNALSPPQPKPEWAEAFLILLLHKTAMLQEQLDGTPGIAPQLTVSIADLDRFTKLKTNNKTSLSYDMELKTVTIQAPEAKLPEKIIHAGKKIITKDNLKIE